MLVRDVTAPCRYEWSRGSECYCLLWKHAGTRTRLHALAGLWRPDWGVRSTNAVCVISYSFAWLALRRHEWTLVPGYCLLWKHAGTILRAIAGLCRPDWGAEETNAVFA